MQKPPRAAPKSKPTAAKNRGNQPDETTPAELKPVHLFALCGMSPAVVFETIWALVRRCGETPASVTIITTAEAEERLNTILPGNWKVFCKRLGIITPYPEIKVPGKSSGHPIADLRTPADCAVYEAALLEILNRNDKSDTIRRRLSVAGGRKSMGVSAATVFALSAVAGDKLLHVLVNAPYDNPALKPAFMYPESGDIHLDEAGREHRASDACIELTEIPFVPLGDLLGGGAKKTGTLKERVEVLRDEVELRSQPPHIELQAKVKADAKSPGMLRVRIGRLERVTLLGYKQAIILLDLLANPEPEKTPSMEAAFKRISAVQKSSVVGDALRNLYEGKVVNLGSIDDYKSRLGELRKVLGERLLPPNEKGLRLEAGDAQSLQGWLDKQHTGVVAEAIPDILSKQYTSIVVRLLPLFREKSQ